MNITSTHWFTKYWFGKYVYSLGRLMGMYRRGVMHSRMACTCPHPLMAIDSVPMVIDGKPLSQAGTIVTKSAL